MADDNPIRIGIMGCAEIARKVSRAINLSPNSTLHAIASRSIEKAEQFAVRNGLPETVKLYGNYGELLDDPTVDAVYMPLPTSLHLKWAVLAAEKKKHLILEKPTALNVSEFDRIIEACESNGVQFMDGSMWYHHPRTAKVKEFISDSKLFGQIRSIHSSSSFIIPGQDFLNNNIRVKPDLDALGALGDAGWYCIGAILWAMNFQLPTTVTALPTLSRNSAGVILTCAASFNWLEQQTTATFYCSFLAHETMDLAVSGLNGTVHIEDLIIPYEETSAPFRFTSGAKFADLHIGWSAKPKVVDVATEIPQESLMVTEFSRLAKGIKGSGRGPDGKWAAISRATQLVMDAVNKSIDLGFHPVYM